MKKKDIIIKKLTVSLPILLIILFAFLLFGSTLFPPTGKMIYGSDIYDAYYFWKSYLASSIRSGIIPFWNPYNFSGTAFLAHPNINIFYPPNWMFIILPLNWSFSWYFFVHMVIAGINMYWLARSYTTRSGALLSAITYAFGGFFVARIYSGHLEYVDAASWLPLVFGLTRKAFLIPTRRNIIFSGLGMAILLLSGNELFFLFALELLLLLSVFLSITKHKEKQSLIVYLFRYIRVGFFSVVVGFGLAAIELLPRYQFLGLSLRLQGIPYSLAGSGSLPLSGLILFFNPFFWGKAFSNNYTYRGPWPNLFEYTHYVGILPVLVVIFFVILFFLSRLIRIIKIKKINKEIWFYILFIIPIFLIISLGNQIPVNIHYFLWKYLPFYKSIRFPARHLFLVAFSLSITSGMVIGSLKTRAIRALFITIVIIDLFLFGRQFLKTSDIPVKTFDNELISFLGENTELDRLLPDFSVVSEVRRDLDFGAALLYHIPTTSDYNAMILWKYYRFIDLLNGSKTPSVQYFNVEIPPPDPKSPYVDFLNIKYLLVDKKYDNISKQYLGKYIPQKEKQRYKLFENTTYLPRFFFVGSAVIYPNTKEMENVLLQSFPDLSKTVLLLKSDLEPGKNYDLDCQTPQRGEINILSYNPNKFVLSTKSPCNNFISTSEVYYPGWKARIDGIDTKIYLSNYSFRSIYLPKGEHTVEFYYQPSIFYAGGIITIITVISIIIFINKSKK